MRTSPIIRTTSESQSRVLNWNRFLITSPNPPTQYHACAYQSLAKAETGAYQSLAKAETSSQQGNRAGMQFSLWCVRDPHTKCGVGNLPYAHMTRRTVQPGWVAVKRCCAALPKTVQDQHKI